jgi:hypothetical protein
VGGPPLVAIICLLGIFYYNGQHLHFVHRIQEVNSLPAAKVYGQTSRDMRRLGAFYQHLDSTGDLLAPPDSVSRSPLYSIYGETIAGVPVLRAFGASSKLLRDMIQCVDTVSAVIFVLLTP